MPRQLPFPDTIGASYYINTACAPQARNNNPNTNLKIYILGGANFFRFFLWRIACQFPPGNLLRFFFVGVWLKLLFYPIDKLFYPW